jgi:hypothetical protein
MDRVRCSYRNFFVSHALFYRDYFFHDKDARRCCPHHCHNRRRRSAKTEFPINRGTEDPRYKWELEIGRMHFKAKQIYIIEFISIKFTTQAKYIFLSDY